MGFSGRKLKELRKGKCMTWKKLAETAGVHWTMIASYERGKSQPRTDRLIVLANALGVDVKELFE